MQEKNNAAEMEKLWQAYAKTRDDALREKLILSYAYLVKLVAGRLRIHVGNHVDFDDMVSYGIFGLIDAVEKFDAVKGVKFETYASLRIRGSIIDFLRKLDWVPRALRQKSRQLSLVYTDLETTLGREPTDAELADKLDVPVGEVKDMVKHSSIASLISLDDYLNQNYETPIVIDYRQSEPAANPEKQYQRKETRRMLAEAIDKLSEKEKKVLSLYYFEDLTLKEISVIMGVSESRVSQIHSKAMLRLRAKLDRQKELLFL